MYIYYRCGRTQFAPTLVLPMPYDNNNPIGESEMNVYDFDKTIYDGDSSIDFYLFSLKKNPLIAVLLPYQAIAMTMYKLKMMGKTEMKEKFYKYFKFIKDIDGDLEIFWDKNQHKIKKWYKKKDDDVIISASPEFLLEPICKRLEIKYLLGSIVDKKNGKYTGLNCYHAEKVIRFKTVFKDAQIDEFYSDSLSDSPLAEISNSAYLVNKDTLLPWS